ncbi:hypothetical protein [Streptomyces sp. NBC_01022]|uniref:hypothetical protein n=1 Tax=Streptomyces sp. NBC_01022 TaxID=2903723 RepID=UPI002DD9BEE5|nr:hypothetical protein [Streptomyces sp. NBC_01022]WRZ83211.1 hypothetical protein OG316_24670 [Streptomyces sp. NBC_01022]
MSLTTRLRQSAAAAALLALTVTACGTEHAGQQQAQSAVPRPSFTPRPKCAQPAEAPPAPVPSSPTASTTGTPQQGTNDDQPPNYADNHAYRMAAELSPAKRAKGEASAALIESELEKVRKEGDVSEKRITKALAHLGCGKEHGVYIWDSFYSVHTGDVCVSGHVTEQELTIQVHGAYAEPQPGTGPCVENRGGH